MIQHFMVPFQVHLIANICNSIVLCYYVSLSLSHKFFSFLSNMIKFAEPNYTPSAQDTLLLPSKSGIREIAFEFENTEYK